MTSLYIIYLLHAERCPLPYRHYCGITRADQLARRIHDHIAGRASLTTRKMLAAGATIYLARTWPTDNPEDERTRKRASHFSRDCPICREGQLPLALPIPT